MPQRATLEVREIGPLEMVEAIADQLDEQAGIVFSKANPSDQGELDCAGKYARTVRQLASRLRYAVRNFESQVEEHLEGTCKPH